ncbi:zinc finger, CCHC-type containing protein [Tanacetum coccineum]
MFDEYFNPPSSVVSRGLPAIALQVADTIGTPLLTSIGQDAPSTRDANPVRTLGDYSKPSHEGYRNTIELPVGNKVCKIDRATGRKICNKNPDESWKIIENLALYDHEGWNDAKEFIKPVKAISTPQPTSKTPDRRLLELEDQINFLLKGSRLTPRPSSTHVPQAYAEAVYSNPRPRNQNEPPKQNPFTFRERTNQIPQPHALGTTFEARVRDYMAIHTERMERFKNAIFKQREEINGRMIEMFGLFKELTTSRAPEKDGVLVEVAEHVYPIDFVILDIKEDEKRPFNLGIPFLTTAKAVIKFDKGTITLRSGKSKISFHRIPESLCKAGKGIKNDIEPIAPTMTVNRLVLEWEEKIKLHQEKEMEFDRWRNKNFKNERPAPVKIEDNVDDEGEVV